jgi:hypothetical protein
VYRLLGVAGLRGVLSGGGLHVLGAGRGSSAVWEDFGGSAFVHWVQALY